MCGCWVEVWTTSWSRRRMPVGDHAAAFERAHDLARGAQLARDGDGGLGLDGLEVDVGGGGQEQVVAPVLVHQRRAGLARRPACRRPRAAARGRARSRRRGPRPRRGSGPRTWRPARRRSAPCPWRGSAAREDLKPGSVVSARIGATPARSSAMNTRSRMAGGMRMALMRACASGLRRNATSSMPGSLMSPTYWPAPAHVAVVLLAQEPRADALVSDVLSTPARLHRVPLSHI